MHISIDLWTYPSCFNESKANLIESILKAKMYIDEGKVFLESFEDCEEKKSLIAISDYIIERRT